MQGSGHNSDGERTGGTAHGVRGEERGLSAPVEERDGYYAGTAGVLCDSMRCLVRLSCRNCRLVCSHLCSTCSKCSRRTDLVSRGKGSILYFVGCFDLSPFRTQFW